MLRIVAVAIVFGQGAISSSASSGKMRRESSSRPLSRRWVSTANGTTPATLLHPGKFVSTLAMVYLRPSH